MGYDKFVTAIRRELPRWGASRVYRKIVRGLWDALADAGGVAAQRRGALERVHLLMADWRSLLARLAEVEQRMCAVLDELGLTELVTSIELSAAGAAGSWPRPGSCPGSPGAVGGARGAELAENTSATPDARSPAAVSRRTAARRRLSRRRT
jgi:hypothetical protein